MTQTVILTRLSGQTPMPPEENLRSLASHHCSLVVFLSTGMIETVVNKLIEAGYPASTSIAVVYRAS